MTISMLSALTTPTPDRLDAAIAASEIRIGYVGEDGLPVLNRTRLLYDSFPYFYSQLLDDTGKPLIVEEFHEEWAGYIQQEELLVLMAPRDHGKALALDTPIPTPTGWTTMGDLRAGDSVIGDDGKPCCVVYAHPVQRGRPTYRVTFDDGASIVADAEHEWAVQDYWERRRAMDRARRPRWAGGSAPTESIRTTREMAGSVKVKGQRNYSVAVAGALTLPEADLPIEPYLLGAWLGDGTSANGTVTVADDEMLAALVAAGAVLRKRPSSTTTLLVEGLQKALRAAGLLGNKHVPQAYLRASEVQRRALLAGLMDTDGSASRSDGTVEFVSTSPDLAEAVHELAASLGWKPRTITGTARLNGRDIGPKWRICWTPDESPFRMPRKAQRVRKGRATVRHRRFIESIEPVESVPVRCITVDSPSRLFLAGRSMVPTHNSFIARGYLLWKAWRHNRDRDTGMLLDGLPEGQFEAVLFSETLPQAGTFFEGLQSLIIANTVLFADILPEFRRRSRSSLRDVWSRRRMRLRNLFECSIRAFRTSTRGLHPDLLLLDDVLSEKNSLTAYQRGKVWTYFVGTLMPMNAKQVIVIGCLATGTPVLMADGTWRAIERVSTGEEVWAVNTRGEWLRRRVDALLDQGVAETVEVVTDRATVRATPWHPFLVANGSNLTWRRADALVPGDRVVEVKEVPGRLDHGWMTPDFCWLMGFLMGDGWVTSGRTSIWAALGVHEDVNDRVVALLRDWMPAVEFSVVPLGPRNGGYVRGDNRPAAAALADLGLSGKATTKRLPDWLFRAPPEHRREFIRGLCAADGSRMARSTDSSRLEMANGALIEDVRRLAMGSGIRVGRVLHRSRTLQPPNSPKPVDAESWSISLNFATVDGSEGRHKHVGKRAWGMLGRRARFGRVVEVRPAEPTQVWDLTVSGTHSFVADGLAVHNTTQHYDDLLFRLRPRKGAPDLIVGNRRARFKWLRYRAVNWEVERVLWPGRHGIEDLRARRDQDALLFSREFQNEPRDDASSMFPWALTGVAVTAGADMTFVTEFIKRPTELVVLGMDLAASEEIGADYTVLGVAAYDRATQQRRLLYAVRERGLSFRQQLDLLRFSCKGLNVDLGIVEENGFQKWLFTESQRYPETSGRLIGHRTGREKTNLAEGVPAIKLALLNGLWTVPSGDVQSREFAGIWQSEMAAMGWKDGKLQGVSEHDDCVMMFWFLERAVRLVEEWVGRTPDVQTVYAEDVGIDDGYVISGDY